ncbi:hypothetical protein KHO57_gp243 [Mycobacterium phage Phabba]|uniref:Uncharacterized protein n=1 Tax=Mycobacterium phage Phabba TaxID=2027899 RepID=A0A249XSF3_9CAUD|nr:hypothetical protein KHO57_gp243 [Mycobacterium phage Phabba]ASZ74661.1 hypothetical protein SEA_PHABBA_92 [Mycobacterium phage Phabba]
MSDFGLFEADTDAQQAPQRQQRQAANKLANAIYDVKDQYGPFLMGSTGKDEFEDRWHHAKNDIRKTVEAAGAFPNTGVMRRIHNAMKRDFVATLGDDNAEDPTKKPKKDGDGDSRTINDSQYKKVRDGDPSVKDNVKTNTGDGSDAEGNNPSSTTGKQSDPRDTDKYRKASARALLAENFEGDLVPDDNFEGYLDSVDQGGPEKVQRNFTDGDDSGTDRTSAREARRLAIDLYKDFAETNELRVAKLSTLNHYADTGIDDSTYFLLANLIRQADENCDCDDDEDTDGPQGSDTDSDGPPKGAAEKGGESSEDSDDDDDSDDSDSDDSGSSDDGGSESDSDSGDSGENPFAGGDEGSDAPSEDAGPPADDAGPMGDPQAPPGPPDLGPEDGGDPAGPPPEAQAPPGPPQLDDAPPLAQDDFSGVDEFSPQDAGGLPPNTELVQVEQIEDALGLPPGTLEQLLADSVAHGGPPQPHGAGPVASRRYVAFGEGADPAAGGQAVAPAAPAPAGPPAPAMPGPDDGALLDQASQAVTNLVDVKTQEFQTIIDPLQQALQAIQFAQQVEQAANPMDVTPPEGTVDVSPQSAVDPAAQAGAASIQAPAPQTSVGPPPPGPGAAPAPAPSGGDSGGGESDSSSEKKESSLAIRRHAFKLAQYWGLSEQGYQTVLAAMSRKHYQHVAEAIQTLPPEHRMGIAASLADMFSTDNVRFNTGQFMASAGVPVGQDAVHLAGNPRDRAGDSWRDGKDRRDAEAEDYDTDPDNWEEREAARLGLRQGSRRPFVIRSRTTGGGRTAGETWKPPGGGQSLDSFEFPGQGEKAEFSDNNKLTDLPGEKKSAGIVEDYQRYDKRQSTEGLNAGGEGEVDQFLQNKKVGPRAQNKLHETLGLEPHQKAANFQPQVEGWAFDNHLNGYVSHVRQAFHCPCGQAHNPPSHGMCRCGKLWYTYAIGTGQHLANGNEAEMFLAREIPVRENVIMANRQFHSAEEYNNASGNGPFQDYAEDVEFYDDDEIDESTPHAPGETDMDTRRSAAIEHEDPDHTDPAFGGWPFEEHKPKRNDGKKTGASYGEDDHNVVERDGEKFCSACDAMLWDPNVHHCPAKQASRSFFADWTKFTDDDNAGYDTGAEAPSTTPGKQPPKDWAKRDDKGNWVKPQFK